MFLLNDWGPRGSLKFLAGGPASLGFAVVRCCKFLVVRRTSFLALRLWYLLAFIFRRLCSRWRSLSGGEGLLSGRSGSGTGFLSLPGRSGVQARSVTWMVVLAFESA